MWTRAPAAQRIGKAHMTANRITRRQFSTMLAASAAAAGMFPISAHAQQNYPNRPVRFVLPFAAAGVADITARLAAEKLGDKFGQRFVVENQPGPGGIAAARAVLIVALMRNDVQLMVDFYAPMKATLLDKKIRAVATTGKERSPFFADVPTVAEAGVPGYEVVSWNGVFAPRGTPADVIELLNKTIREIVATPEVKQRYAELGIEAKASTPEELKARLAGDIGKWAAVIERAGIPKQ